MPADRVISYPADAARRLADRLQDDWHMDGEDALEIATEIVVDVTEAVDKLRALEAKEAAEAADFGPRQVITSQYGDYEVAVARHAGAPTFTFDVIVPVGQVEVYGVTRVLSCHNMTREQLKEHVARCQAALAAPATEEDR